MRVFLAIADTKNQTSFYQLEEWQLQTFIRMTQNNPVDGFQWLYENCYDQWHAKINEIHRGEPILHYDMTQPATMTELLVEFDMVFLSDGGYNSSPPNDDGWTQFPWRD